MRWVGCGLLVAALALPASFGQDKKDDTPPPAKDGKDEKKPLSTKEQYQALLKEFNGKRQELVPRINKAKGPEQQELLNKYFGLAKEFAPKFYQLAEDNPKDPVATDALFWVIQNGNDSPVHAKAAEKVTARIGEMPLTELHQKLLMVRGGSPALLDAVAKRAEKDEKDPMAGNLLGWVATNGGHLPVGQAAIARLVEKHPDHAAVRQVCAVLARSRDPKAADTLKQILDKSPKAEVKAAAALSLGRRLAEEADRLADNPAEADRVAAEGEKYLVMVTDQFAKDAVAPKKGDAPEVQVRFTQRTQAEQELKALRTLRVGKEAPEIQGPDLDGKEFKLSDYRGKVVLLDFWGHW